LAFRKLSVNLSKNSLKSESVRDHVPTWSGRWDMKPG
jgi:hypothetical protein